jgi:hypothetical protein
MSDDLDDGIDLDRGMYEACLQLTQRTQQLARLLLSRPELVTRTMLEHWETAAILLQPDLVHLIREAHVAIALTTGRLDEDPGETVQ